MDEQLAAADAALRAGDRPEAARLLIAALTADPNRPVQIYRVLCMQLYRLGRYAEGEHWTAEALKRGPQEGDLWNLRAVLLRRLGRLPEALEAADRAVETTDQNIAARVNRANIITDMGRFEDAHGEWVKLIAEDPDSAEHRRLLGRVLVQLRREDEAIARFQEAVSIEPGAENAWIDLAGVYIHLGRADEAIDVIDRGLVQHPEAKSLVGAKATILRRAGRTREAEAFLAELIARFPNSALVHYHMGLSVADGDRNRGNELFRRAVELEPTLPHLGALIESLNRTRTGDEGAHIEEAYRLAKRALALGQKLESAECKTLNEVLWRTADYDAALAVGDMANLGRRWAADGMHSALMAQLGRVRSTEDSHELVDQHRTWGREVDRRAAAYPIVRKPRALGGKIRLGFMSSDLRHHPVGYFALPLFEHIDRERFEVYCYSYALGEPDSAQKFIAKAVDGFRWWPDIAARDAAQRIADDGLDMLIELGGSTHMNKIEVMAYRPARLQASWLGYPHSAGLETIDYLVVDPYILPKDPALLIEKPMVLPNCWYCTSPHAFRAHPAAAAEPPVRKNGFITFGTANNPNKYTPEVVRSWARIVARTPGSRFLFIRPEGGSLGFRENLTALFAKEGVAADRLQFEAVRGRHLPHYNSIDMSLDTFPQTGGTTTCESLWMGAPVVSLVGEALYQRLSYSVLTNLGLGDLCATSVQAYEDTAVGLAADPDRIAELRRTMRERIGASPLGRIEDWVKDFYDTVANTVAAQT